MLTHKDGQDALKADQIFLVVLETRRETVFTTHLAITTKLLRDGLLVR